MPTPDDEVRMRNNLQIMLQRGNNSAVAIQMTLNDIAESYPELATAMEELGTHLANLMSNQYHMENMTVAAMLRDQASREVQREFFATLTDDELDRVMKLLDQIH